MKRYTIRKPEGTFYTDYLISDGKCYAVFEYGSRIITPFVCTTNRNTVINIQETETNLIITI